METIGKKIKRLRTDKGYSQDSIYTLSKKGNSQVSQIENGKIPNPTKPVLQNIATNLDISFEELIKRTDWKPNPMLEKVSREYAYSSVDYDLIIEEGKIILSPKKHSKFDDNGNENKFCPKSGTRLISSCENCKKSIADPNDKFCSGCGKEINILNLSDVLAKIIVADNRLLNFYNYKINLNENIDIRNKFGNIYYSKDKEIWGEKISADQAEQANKYKRKLIQEISKYAESIEEKPFNEREYHISEIEILNREKKAELRSLSAWNNGPALSDWDPECKNIDTIDKLLDKHWKALGILDKEDDNHKKHKLSQVSKLALEKNINSLKSSAKTKKKNKK